MRLPSIFLLLLCLLISLTACEEEGKKSKIPDINSNKDIILEIVDGTLSASGVVVKMTNHSDENLIYGEDFILQKSKNEEWYMIPYKDDKNYGFPDIGYTLEANRIEEMNITWDYAYGKLPRGNYRLIKFFSVEGSGRNYYSAVEFSIE